MTDLFYNDIVDIVEPKSRVLDLGCGDGALLQLLIEKKQVTGLGVEIAEDRVHQCIARGLSVIHGNVDEGLNDFGDQSFDYVILSQTLQVLHQPRVAFKDAVRVGKRVVVTFPNFGHWRIGSFLLLHGRMPKTRELPYEWYDTPNIHLLTTRDFDDFCRLDGLKVLLRRFHGSPSPLVALKPNFFAESAIYVIAASNR